MTSPDSNDDSSKYNVQIGEGKGIVIGDNPHVVQYFYGPLIVAVAIVVLGLVIIVAVTSDGFGGRMSTPPVPVPPSQTLDTFCTAMKRMKAGNNDAAKTLFTDRGWLQFQPPGQTRKAYGSCTYDQVTILDKTNAQDHLVVMTIHDSGTYHIILTLKLEGNSWKIDSWISSYINADALLQSYLG